MKKSQDNLTIDNEYAVQRSEAIQKQLTEKDTFTWQQHHDYYVNKFRKGILLNDVEKGQYGLAMLREKQGSVKPLL